MAEKRVFVTRTVEHISSGEPGQRRVVKTVTTKTSGGNDISQDLLSKFEEFNVSETRNVSTSQVRTFHYVTKDGTVTKTVSSSQPDDVPTVTRKVVKSPQSSPTKTTTTPNPFRVLKTQIAPPAAESTGEFTQDCLRWHNHYRSIHGVPPLKLSSELCRYAEEWAKNIAASDNFRHRPNNKYGENIYMEWSSNPSSKVSGQKPVDSWYSEIKYHQFGREPTSLKSGHFTQVIWKGSRELGVAYGRNKSGKTYVVANYSPAGNMLGSFKDNVPAPSK